MNGLIESDVHDTYKHVASMWGIGREFPTVTLWVPLHPALDELQRWPQARDPVLT